MADELFGRYEHRAIIVRFVNPTIEPSPTLRYSVVTDRFRTSDGESIIFDGLTEEDGTFAPEAACLVQIDTEEVR